MKKLLLLCLLVLPGCIQWKTTYSPELREQAVVVDLAYCPPTHGSGTGVGVTGGGNIAVSSVSVSTQPAWATVFRCQHGQFIVQGEETYRSVSEGDTVTVVYREVYRDDYDTKLKEYVKRTLVDYDFLYVENRRPRR